IVEDDNIAIAIVGSRRATYYGLQNAEKLGFELAAQGITIVSGLARGIDSAAHKAALAAGGRTIAVLGSGLNVIYPPENLELSARIANHGAVISEFPLDTAPYPGNFPKRNRIISGLTLGIIVVEAAKRSGALITANCALEQGREVFALPGKIDSFSSVGVHGLIKQGAKLVETSADVIEELEALKFLRLARDQNKINRKLDLPDQENKVYACLGSEPIHIDEITQGLGLSSGKLLGCLLRLQHRKLVKELPGKLFARS
ncbi:DNA-processing protein DprA, partial [Candidatus Omnitrophota bacterium]